MIPAEFEYSAPDTLEDAIALLAEGGEDAKALAGGHSLLPLMKLRLAFPTMLVDLRRLPGMSGVSRSNGEFAIGAMTRHAEVEHSPELGLLARVAGTIADPQVRHMGTVGGSLAHGDPASDLPAILLATEGSLRLQGPDGERTVAAKDFFQDFLTVDLRQGELVTEVRIPAMDGWGFAYQKFNRRAEDWAMVAVSALVHVRDGTIEEARVGLTNMATVPLRATAVEEALRGQPVEGDRIEQAAEHVAEGTDPPGDLNASAEYKRHLAQVLCRRALREAAGTG